MLYIYIHITEKYDIPMDFVVPSFQTNPNSVKHEI